MSAYYVLCERTLRIMYVHAMYCVSACYALCERTLRIMYAHAMHCVSACCALCEHMYVHAMHTH